MLTRIYKNNNFTIKYEPFYDEKTPDTMGELLEAIQNNIDAPDIFDIEETYAGNSYAYYYVTFFVNGAKRFYRFDSEMLERYQSGHTIRFVYEDDAPLFTLPTFHDFKTGIVHTPTGRKGTIYHLSEQPDEETREEMIIAGCEFLTAQHKYAPEMKEQCVFVPNGTCFAFC